MKNQSPLSEHGQALVYIAITMVVVLAIAVLAIDVGHLYSERRRMQNAADAGALAGAQQICIGTPAAATAVAADFAVNKNLAPNAQVGVTMNTGGGGGIVKVLANETTWGLYARWASQPDPSVGANAAAACGPACEVCNLWPIGMAQTDWNQIVAANSAACTADPKGWGGSFTLLEKTTDSKASLGGDTCWDWGTTGIAVPAQVTTWVDFTQALSNLTYDPCSQPGNGTKELGFHLQGHNDSGQNCYVCFKKDVSCIVPDTGDRATAWRLASAQGTAAQPSTGRKIPLIGPAGAGSGCAQNKMPTVTGFGCARVLGQVPARPLSPWDNVLCGNKNQNPGFVMQYGCQQNPDCYDPRGSTCGGVINPGDASAVSLSQ